MQVQHRILYSDPILLSEARRELAEWEPYFQQVSADPSKTPKQHSDARLLKGFAEWAMGEFERASTIVQCLDLESIEYEIAGLESWLADMHWRDQERLEESIHFAQLRIDDLSQQLENSAEYRRYSDQVSLDDSIKGVAKIVLVRLRSEYREYREYRDTVTPDLVVRYASAMDSLNVPNDAAIRYRLDMIGSTEFEPRRPEPPLSLEIRGCIDEGVGEYIEEDFLRVLQELDQDFDRRRARVPKKESGLHLTDLPKTLISEETALAESAETPPAPVPPPSSSGVPEGTNENKAGDPLLPPMDFSTKEGRVRAIKDFIEYIRQTKQERITRKDIWEKRIVNGMERGYLHKSDFGDWQNGKSSEPAKRYFEDILRMKLRIF